MAIFGLIYSYFWSYNDTHYNIHVLIVCIYNTLTHRYDT